MAVGGAGGTNPAEECDTPGEKSFFSRKVTVLFAERPPSAEGLDVPAHEPVKFALGLAAQPRDAVASDDQPGPSGQLQGDDRARPGMPSASPCRASRIAASPPNDASRCGRPSALGNSSG